MKNKIRIGIIGSCATRDIFTTNYNKYYKKYFDLIFSQERVSLISLFQSPLKIDIDSLKILPENGQNQFRTKNLKNDFTKSFFNDFEKGIDYLILDMFFESLFGILIFEDNIITNNTWDLPLTPFYSSIDNKETLTMSENSEIYFKIWALACDNLFKFLDKYPNVQVILNKINLTFNEINDDFSYNRREDLKQIANHYSKYIKQFENYIEENYDVLILKNNDIPFTGINSAWDPYVVHYSEDYYKKIFLELCKICEINTYDLTNFENEYLNSRMNLYNEIIKRNILNYPNLPKKLTSKNFEKYEFLDTNNNSNIGCVISDWHVIRSKRVIDETSIQIVATDKYAHNIAGSINKKFDLPYCIEFDLLDFKGDVGINLYDGENYNNIIWLSEKGHYKIEISSMEISATVNEKYLKVPPIPKNPLRTSFYISSKGQYIKYENFMIYTIELIIFDKI